MENHLAPGIIHAKNKGGENTTMGDKIRRIWQSQESQSQAMFLTGVQQKKAHGDPEAEPRPPPLPPTQNAPTEGSKSTYTRFHFPEI